MARYLKGKNLGEGKTLYFHDENCHTILVGWKTTESEKYFYLYRNRKQVLPADWQNL